MDTKTTNFNENYTMSFNRTHSAYCLVIFLLASFLSFLVIDRQRDKRTEQEFATQLATIKSQIDMKAGNLQRIRSNNQKNTEDIKNLFDVNKRLTTLISKCQIDFQTRFNKLNSDTSERQSATFKEEPKEVPKEEPKTEVKSPPKKVTKAPQAEASYHDNQGWKRYR